MLVALGVLGGIGLGIPIGREQQARVDAQPVNLDEPQGWRSASDSVRRHGAAAVAAGERRRRRPSIRAADTDL